MDILCFVLGVCCWVFNSTALHIVTICLSSITFALLIAINVAKRETSRERMLSIIITLLSLSSGIVCLCV